MNEQHKPITTHEHGGFGRRLVETLCRFHDDESGATATEYLILLVLVACFIIAVVKLFGQTLEEKYGWADERVYKFVTF